MALQPSLRPLVVAGRINSPHTLDIFVDYVCPYSAKIARAIDTVLKPLLDAGGKYDGQVKVILRPQVQPWHASSTLTHEAALAVLRVAPANFWDFALALFNHQEEYYDIPTSTLTPLQIRESLAKLAGTVISPTQLTEFKELLKLKSSPNGGVAVTDDLKYTIKFSRQNSIHVSPTVLWDGLVAGEVSSGWGEKEWSDFLNAKVQV